MAERSGSVDYTKKGDAMNALEGEMKKMVEEHKKFIDQNRKDDDSGSDNAEDSEEGGLVNEFVFISALDVGSHFCDVDPAHELPF